MDLSNNSTSLEYQNMDRIIPDMLKNQLEYLINSKLDLHRRDVRSLSNLEHHVERSNLEYHVGVIGCPTRDLSLK